MCKTWSITYSCSHAFQFHLSICHGTFTTQTKKTSTPKIMCCSAPVLTFRSLAKCGPCQRTDAEQALDARIRKIQARFEDWSSRPEYHEAEAQRSYQCFLLDRRFPSQRFEQRLLRPGWNPNGPTMSRRSGLLSREVKPEDVVAKEQWGASTASEGYGWVDWGTRYGSLSDEIAEDEEMKDEAIREYEAGMMEAHQRWLADDPLVDEAGADLEVEAHVVNDEGSGTGAFVTTENLGGFEVCASVLGPTSQKENVDTSTKALPPHRRQRQDFTKFTEMLDGDCKGGRFSSAERLQCCHRLLAVST